MLTFITQLYMLHQLQTSKSSSRTGILPNACLCLDKQYLKTSCLREINLIIIIVLTLLSPGRICVYLKHIYSLVQQDFRASENMLHSPVSEVMEQPS